MAEKSSRKKNQKLWGGRFQQETAQLMEEFNASVSFDSRFYAEDIAGSIAHAKMLARQKIITQKDARSIVKGLQKIQKQIEAGEFEWRSDREDVHLNIEAELTALIGEAGGRLHSGRSRNDQVATDFRLFCRKQGQTILALLHDIQKSLVQKASENIDTLLPGYTHLQRAQPISLAHHLLAFHEMFERDVQRLQDALQRVNVMPLGAGALAGTTFPIDRHFVAEELGFASLAENSLDAVSDRDFVIELLAAFSLIMMHLSRLAEEWILWTSQEFQFILLPEGFCTGSSMMPQKINPDALELMRGKSARVFASLQSLLVLMKGLPLTYNKDMQEDKELFFDAVDTVQICLKVLAQMLPGVQFRADKMLQSLSEGFVLATDLAEYLVTKGVAFRTAHHIVGALVQSCQSKGRALEELSLEELQAACEPFEKDVRIGPDVRSYLDYGKAVDRRLSYGGTARSLIRRRIKKLQKKYQML